MKTKTKKCVRNSNGWQEVRHSHSIVEACESRWREGLCTLQLQVIRNYADERELMDMVNELLGIQ